MACRNSSRAFVRIGVDAAECMELLKRRKGEIGIDYAYRTLEYNIMMLKIPPGALVREAEIASKLNMSKTPVHQAINLLRDQTLVDVKARSATHVSRVNLNALDQGFFLRSTVEPAVIFQLVGIMPKTRLDELSSNLDAQRTLISKGGDPYDFIALDDAFHRIIYRTAGKTLVWSSIKKVTTHFDRVRYMGLVFGYENPDTEEHRRILELLAESSKATAEDIKGFIAHHLSHYRTHFDAMVADHADYFVSAKQA